jgi:hypothetical protein
MRMQSYLSSTFVFVFGSALALSAGCGELGSASDSTSTELSSGSLPGGALELVQVGSGLCLSIAAGAGLNEESCNGSTIQQFSFAAQANGQYQIRTGAGLCLTQGANNKSSIQLTASTCSATNAKQLYVPQLISGTTYGFKTSDGVGCVDVAGFAATSARQDQRLGDRWR